jgi:hypothetical protein
MQPLEPTRRLFKVQAGSLRPERGKEDRGEARQIKIGLGSATEADPKKIELAKTA